MAEKVTAEELSSQQQEISVAEFFEKNRHLLGFDNKKRALLTTIKEAVDNSIDACEEAGVLPSISVKINEVDENRHVVRVRDNGPGIVKDQIPKIFAKLLYGSKFHSMKQTRGQQGIGISAAGLYGQLSTGQPTKIKSRTSPDKKAQMYKVRIDTTENKPEITEEKEIEWEHERGTEVIIELDGYYQKGHHSIDNYLRQTAIANPHVEFEYKNPREEEITYERTADSLPDEPEEIKPHPYGVELGELMKMIKNTDHNKVSAFLKGEFSRVSRRVCKEILDKTSLTNKSWIKSVGLEEAEEIHEAIKEVDIMSPPTNCLSEIGEDLILTGMKDVLSAEEYFATTRKPEVYRGNPFLIEAGIAYGGDLPKDEPVEILRYANKVPLLYKRSACAATKAVKKVNWKNYDLSQPKGSKPVGPAVIMVHIASVWVPFTSESKEAIAHYPGIVKEMKLALQECGRKLGKYIRKKDRAKKMKKRANVFEKYIPEVADSISELTNEDKEALMEELEDHVDKPTLEEFDQ